MPLKYPVYSPFMSFNDHSILITKNFPTFLNSLSMSLENQINRIVKSDYSYKNLMGGYLFLIRDKLYAPFLKFFLRNKIAGFAIPIALLIITIFSISFAFTENKSEIIINADQIKVIDNENKIKAKV